jgi:hypothetical protein
MTAAAEAGVMTDREAEAVTLARETAAQTGEIGALIGDVAEWADDALAGGKPPKWVALRLITAGRLIAAAARGEAAAP